MANDTRKLGDVPVYLVYFIGYVVILILVFVIIKATIKPAPKQLEVTLVDEA